MVIKYKVGDVYFDEEGTFIRIIGITDTHVRYAIKYHKDEVYDIYDNGATFAEIDLGIDIKAFRKYTKVARLLYGKF